jgi:hypothetical protein
MKKIIFTLTTSFLLSFYGMAQPATGLDFDGVDDYVSCGSILTPSYTKEAWINTSNLSAFNNIISSGVNGNHAFWAPNSYGSRLSAGHNFTWNAVQDPTPLAVSTWYHVAVTYDAATTTMRLYKNGVLVSSNNAVPAHTGGNGVSIGAYGNGFVFFGLIDEVRLWDRALCQGEIQNNMNCGLNPSGQTGLGALYHFDQGTVNANNAGITTLTDASSTGSNGTLNNFALTGATSNWATGTVSGSCSPFVPNTLAGTPGGGTITNTITVNPSGSNTLASDCGLITTILPSGATPVSGSITSRVTIDASVQSYNSSPYVQRHYDIEPATNAANATGTITLYYTQTEFDDYNTARGANPALPVSGVDAAGIANLRITQYHGTGTAPGNYSGSPILIDPADANIVWNAGLSRWEVTSDVNGFSGFFVHTSFGFVLPVNLISFSGTGNGAYNKIQWVTSGEQNSDFFDLERSTDGISFSKTATIPAQNNSSSNRNYSYNDLKGNSSVYYYRLKMVDRDGTFKYSAIIRISSRQNSIISVYPNPAKEIITVSVSDTKLLKTDIRLTDMNGRLVSIVNLKSLQQPVDITRLNAGTYIIQFTDGSIIKFVKQ